MWRGDKGSASIAVTAIVLVVAVLSFAVAGLGSVFAAAAKASNGADAIALGVAVATYPEASDRSPDMVASDLARRNEVRLVSCGCQVDHRLTVRNVEVEVSVVVDLPIFGPIDVRRRARAEFDPRRWMGR